MMNSHTRSHTCAPIKTTEMLLPSYKKQSFVRAVFLSVEKQAAAAVLTSSSSSTNNDDPFLFI